MKFYRVKYNIVRKGIDCDELNLYFIIRKEIYCAELSLYWAYNHIL